MSSPNQSAPWHRLFPAEAMSEILGLDAETIGVLHVVTLLVGVTGAPVSVAMLKARLPRTVRPVDEVLEMLDAVGLIVRQNGTVTHLRTQEAVAEAWARREAQCEKGRKGGLRKAENARAAEQEASTATAQLQHSHSYASYQPLAEPSQLQLQSQSQNKKPLISSSSLETPREENPPEREEEDSPPAADSARQGEPESPGNVVAHPAAKTFRLTPTLDRWGERALTCPAGEVLAAWEDIAARAGAVRFGGLRGTESAATPPQAGRVACPPADALRKALEPVWRDEWRGDMGRVRALMQRVADSDWCCGRKPGGNWRADFMWFIRPGTATALEAGKYDNRSGAAPAADVSWADPYGETTEQYFARRDAEEAAARAAREAAEGVHARG